MHNVFTRGAHKSKPHLDTSVISQRIASRLKDGEWASTTNLYDATGHHVKRDVLHEVLKAMLKEKVIKMRTVDSINKHSMKRTEFKLFCYPLEQPCK